jgi:hypothetical protein
MTPGSVVLLKRRATMTDKPDPTSDAARTGDKPDENRKKLVEEAEKGIKDATRKPAGKDA